MNILELFLWSSLIPIILIIVAGVIKYNEKIKKIVFSIFAFIYNFIIGIFNFFWLDAFIYFFITRNKVMEGLKYLLIYLLIVIPINIFMKKKGKIKLGIYLIIIITATVLGMVFLFNVIFEKYIVGK